MTRREILELAESAYPGVTSQADSVAALIHAELTTFVPDQGRPAEMFAAARAALKAAVAEVEGVIAALQLAEDGPQHP